MSLENKELFLKISTLLKLHQKTTEDSLSYVIQVKDLNNTILQYLVFLEITREALTLEILEGKTDFSGYIFGQIDYNTHTYVPGDLSRIDMSRLDFTGSYLLGVKFTSSILNNTIMKRCHLEKAEFFHTTGDNIDFTDAYLDESKIGLSKIINSKFDSASLTNAKLLESKLDGSTFRDSRLIGTQFCTSDTEELPSSMHNVDLSGAIISKKTNFYKYGLDSVKLNKIAIYEEVKEKKISSKKSMEKTSSDLLNEIQENPDFLKAVKSVISISKEDRPKAVLCYLLTNYCSLKINFFLPNMKLAKKFLQILSDKSTNRINEVLKEFSKIRKSLTKNDPVLKIFQFYEVYSGDSLKPGWNLTHFNKGGR